MSAPQYLTNADLTAAVTTYGGQGVDFTTLTSGQLTNLIVQASRKIDGYLRDSLVQRQIIENCSGTGTNTLRLRRYPIWQGLATTLTSSVAIGDTTIHLASATGLLPGQLIRWGNGKETQIAIASSYTTGTSIPLASPTLATHASGEAIQVGPVDSILVLLPGQSVYTIDITQLVVQPELGRLVLYSTLFIPLFGYASIFPKDVPFQVTYTAGYLTYPDPIQQVCLELCITTLVRNASVLANAGKQSIRIRDMSITFAQNMPELSDDQKHVLNTYKRGQGFF